MTTYPANTPFTAEEETLLQEAICTQQAFFDTKPQRRTAVNHLYFMHNTIAMLPHASDRFQETLSQTVQQECLHIKTPKRTHIVKQYIENRLLSDPPLQPVGLRLLMILEENLAPNPLGPAIACREHIHKTRLLYQDPSLRPEPNPVRDDPIQQLIKTYLHL